MGRCRAGEGSIDVSLPVRTRILLALSPGYIDACALYERIPGASNPVVALLAEGMILREGRGVDAVYRLTAQGRAALPKRRDLIKPIGLSDEPK